MNKIIGREVEKEELLSCYNSDNSEFLAVYGRRRVGKTYLINTFFKDKFDFQLTGLANASFKEQLKNFNFAINKYSGVENNLAESWYDAFSQLIKLLEKKKSKKKVIFIDELPWLDTRKSGFLTAFEHFWNGWAASRNDILLIVCGSATSWMITRLINNRGGLHNRITRRIKLLPFNLKETEEYLNYNGIKWNRHQIIESYMIFGGIPYYLSLIKKGKSLSQTVDDLFFKQNGILRDEYKNLYSSLFTNYESYEKIVEALGKKSKGLSREEILNHTGLSDGGGFSKMLEELEQCDFIRKYNAIDKKLREGLYQLTDFYTLFYFKFVLQNSFKEENFWTTSIDSSQHRAWTGYAFEQVCMAHVHQIRKKLGISGVQCKIASWRSKSSSPNVQIDLVIERKDQVINICEMKFSLNEFEINKSYSNSLINKLSSFRNETGTKSAVHLTMITTYGVKHNEYYDIVQSEVVAADLF
ncbi:MAG TPA: ATP-binding protein [Bacteroidales bacterium]|nr:ATP-binding protein [Bacteroidales bacterium]